MTKDKYYSMCEQMGQEPKPHEIPPDVEDFPRDIQTAMIVYNKLGDRIYPDIGYVGKDFTTLPLHMRINNVEREDLFIEALLRMDNKMITKTQAELKRERDKLKKKGNRPGA